MRLDNIKKNTNNLIRNFVNRNSVVIDATCGNGLDTYFLASKVKKVYAFDIQNEAIKSTKKRCIDFHNIVYINDSHENIKNHVLDSIDLVVFNLGYLPNSSSSITTEHESSIKAIKSSIDILKQNAIVIITIYQGHDNGEEKSKLLDFFSQLDKKKYAILKYEFLNLNDAPFNIVIEKK